MRAPASRGHCRSCALIQPPIPRYGRRRRRTDYNVGQAHLDPTAICSDLFTMGSDLGHLRTNRPSHRYGSRNCSIDLRHLGEHFFPRRRRCVVVHCSYRTPGHLAARANRAQNRGHSRRRSVFPCARRHWFPRRPQTLVVPARNTARANWPTTEVGAEFGRSARRPTRRAK
jgi:hypothetical protein